MGICFWRRHLTIIDACFRRCWAKWLVNNVCSAIMYWSFQQFYPFLFVLDLPMLLWKCDLLWLNADSVKPEVMDCNCGVSSAPDYLLWNTDLYKSSHGLMDCVFSRSSGITAQVLHPPSMSALFLWQVCKSVCVCTYCVCVYACPVHRANALCNHWIQGSMLGFAWTVDSD